MKKLICIFACLAIIIGTLSGCKEKENSDISLERRIYDKRDFKGFK